MRTLAEIDESVERARRVAEEPHRSAAPRPGRLGHVLHLPELARLLKDEMPAVALEVHVEMLTPAQTEALESGRLDLGLLRPPAPSADLTTRLVAHEPLVLALHAITGWSATRKSAWTTCGTRRSSPTPPPAGPSSATPSTVPVAQQDSCHSGSLGPGHTSTLLALVAADLRVALVPASARAASPEGVTFAELPDAPTVDLALAWRTDDASPLVSRLVGVLDRHHYFVDAPASAAAGAPSTARSRPDEHRPDRGLGRGDPFAIPYVKPLAFASGSVSVAEHVLVRVTTTDGLVGVAEAPPRPFTYGETEASIVAVVDSLFAPAAVGTSALHREAIHARLRRTGGQPTAKGRARHGAVGHRRSGLRRPDHRAARRVRRPDAGQSHARLRRPGRHGGRGGADAGRSTGSRRSRSRWVATPTVSTSPCAARCAKAFGEEVELYVDGNRGWSASDSARALREMADLDLLYAEELCPADDVLGRRWLAGRGRPSRWSRTSRRPPRRGDPRAAGGSADAISIKTARTGFTDSQRVLFQCEGLGVDVIMGNQIDGQIGTACTVAFGAAYATTSRRAGELGNFLDMSDDLLTEPLQISGGTLAVRPRCRARAADRRRQARALPHGPLSPSATDDLHRTSSTTRYHTQRSA